MLQCYVLNAMVNHCNEEIHGVQQEGVMGKYNLKTETAAISQGRTYLVTA